MCVHELLCSLSHAWRTFILTHMHSRALAHLHYSHTHTHVHSYAYALSMRGLSERKHMLLNFSQLHTEPSDLHLMMTKETNPYFFKFIHFLMRETPY